MILLASASPRRRRLLADAGLEFAVEPTDVSEVLAEPLGPCAAARHLAERKARAAYERHRGEALRILGADTIVALPRTGAELRPEEDRAQDWHVLGKAAGPAAAEEMLRALSGSRHQVITGVCVFDAALGTWLSDVAVTWVTMRTITAAEIRAYVDSGEWRDKAGAYAIQETADRFVTALEGAGFDNVVGLPVTLALELLGRVGDGPLAGEGARG